GEELCAVPEQGTRSRPRNPNTSRTGTETPGDGPCGRASAGHRTLAAVPGEHRQGSCPAGGDRRWLLGSDRCTTPSDRYAYGRRKPAAARTSRVLLPRSCDPARSVQSEEA